METATLTRALQSIGIEPESVTAISKTDEPVYKVIGSNGKYFAKLLSDEKGTAMRSVLDRDMEIKMPESRIIRDERHVLLMRPARGRPLSFGLPICLLPGMWWQLSDSMIEASRQVGVGLGELHRNTQQGTRRADDDECRMASRLSIGGAFREQFDVSVVEAIETSFDKIRDVRLPFTKIHGDPTPHNIFWKIGSGEVDIIDFNLHTSVALEDLVVFESGIELMVERLPYGRRSQRNALIKSFRFGYTKSGVHDEIPQQTFNMLKIAYYLHLLDKYLGPTVPNTMREKITAYPDKRIIKKKFRLLLSSVQSTA